MKFNPPKNLLLEVDFQDTAPWIFEIPNFNHQDSNDIGEKRSICIAIMRAVVKEKYGEEKDLNLQIIIMSLFLEILKNSNEHGNKFRPDSYTTVGLWLGEKGILYGYRDEGNFYSLPETKTALESRQRIDSTRTDHMRVRGGGIGTSTIILGSASNIYVATEENSLYLSHLFNFIPR